MLLPFHFSRGEEGCANGMLEIPLKSFNRLLTFKNMYSSVSMIKSFLSFITSYLDFLRNVGGICRGNKIVKYCLSFPSFCKNFILFSIFIFNIISTSFSNNNVIEVKGKKKCKNVTNTSSSASRSNKFVRKSIKRSEHSTQFFSIQSCTRINFFFVEINPVISLVFYMSEISRKNLCIYIYKRSLLVSY